METEKKNRKRYDKQFKFNAVQLTMEAGRSTASVARDLGVDEHTLHQWKRVYRDEAERSFPGTGTPGAENEELRRVKRRNAELEEEVAIFKKKSDGLLQRRKEMRYSFIDAHRLLWRISTMSRVLQVSRSGYYAWKKNGPSRREQENERLSGEVREIFLGHRKRYDSRRIADVLRDRGRRYSKKRIAKLLISQGLYAKAARKWKATRRTPGARTEAADLVQRQFGVAAINNVVSSDITYLWTRQGWCYLAVVLDMCSRMIIGYAVSTRLTGGVVVQALERALQHRPLTGGTVFHSDRGSQYGSYELRSVLQAHGIRQSMGATGSCHDNAITESFFHTLKVEAIHGERFETRRELELALFDYIEGFYNTQRKHSALGYRSPKQIEEHMLEV